MSGEQFVVYGKPWRSSAKVDKPVAYRPSLDEARAAAESVRWRMKSRPTRIVRQRDGVAVEEWQL